MASRYRLKIPIGAIYDELGGGLARVMLPAGAILIESSGTSGTVIGMIGVFWEGCHYSVHLRDLLKNAERVQTALDSRLHVDEDDETLRHRIF